MVHGVNVFIYALHDPRDGSLRYIGKTVNLKRRFYGHANERAPSHKNHWIAQLKSLGLKPELRVLEVIENSDDRDWQEKEREWINRSRAAGHNLTNLDAGGNSGPNKSEATKEKIRKLKTGLRHTERTKKKMAATRTGHATSEETRRKISEAHKGMTHTEETRAKIRAARARQVITPATRAKLSAVAKGRRPSPQTIAASVLASRGRVPSEETRAKMRASRAAYFARKMDAAA